MELNERNLYRKTLIQLMGVPVTEGTVMAGSVTTAYLTAGKGELVICLHGAGAGAVTWYPSIKSLADNFQVLAPDIVGYGETDKPDAAYNRPYFASWLNDFMTALNITRAHVIGLSQGGAIAMQFTLDYPEKVRKLVLVDPAGLGAKVSFLALAGMVWMNSFPSALANRFNAPYILHKPEVRDPSHALYSIAVIKGAGGKNAFRQGRGAAVSALTEESLQQITNETLIIWGKEDRMFAAEYGEKAAQIIPNATFKLIEEAGHLPHIDQPEVFNEILMDFFAG